MARNIHPTAVVSPKAQLPDDVEIGPHAVIDGHVAIGDGCIIHAGTLITGHTTIGTGNTIGPYASLGTPPQDLGYDGEPTRLVIGDDNVIREFCTMNTASTKQDCETRVGSRNFIMEYCHVAHDCEVAASPGTPSTPSARPSASSGAHTSPSRRPSTSSPRTTMA